MERPHKTSRARRHLRLARDYARAARAVHPADGASPPFWMLVGHALELSLKAVLLDAGEDEEELMFGVNHSLGAAWRRAQARGFGGPEHQATAALAEALDGPVRMQAFRYPLAFCGARCPLPSPENAAAWLAAHIRRVERRLRTPRSKRPPPVPGKGEGRRGPRAADAASRS